MVESIILVLVCFWTGFIFGYLKKGLDILDDVEELNSLRQDKLRDAIDTDSYDFVYGYLEAIGDVIRKI